MSKKHPDKTLTLRRHFKSRLCDRYGIQATDEDIKKWVAMIQKGIGTMVARQSLRVTIWDIMIDDRKVRVVYDKNRKELITALLRDVQVNWDAVVDITMD